MNRILLGLGMMGFATCLTLARADHMSPWGAGWANMPNDIHNTRIDTRLADDRDAFLDFVRYGVGADSINRYLDVETAAFQAELDSGHQVDWMIARLDPLPDFLGAGWARYTLFDDDRAVSRIFNINVRLRLVQNNGSLANEQLGLTAENAAATVVSAYLRRHDSMDYAICGLVFDGLIWSDDGIPTYATYGLSLKEDQTGVIEGAGECAAPELPGAPLLPDVQLGDLIDVEALTPVMEAELLVLMGGF